MGVKSHGQLRDESDTIQLRIRYQRRGCRVDIFEPPRTYVAGFGLELGL